MISCCFRDTYGVPSDTEATAVVLGKVFERFAEYSTVTVMMRGIMEYVVLPERLDEIFRAGCFMALIAKTATEIFF